MKKYNKTSAMSVLAFLMLFLILFIYGCGNGNTDSPEPVGTDGACTANPTGSPAPIVTESPSPGGRTCMATIYFSSDEGYLLPVTLAIPWEEGIARACLNKLIKNDSNRLEFQQRGIVGVIPDGTTIELNIRDGHATVNLAGITRLASAEEEQRMFTAIINTLTRFRSIDDVTILMNGQAGTTPNGNPLPVQQGEVRLNVEDSDIATSGNAEAVTLYFPNSAGSLAIPITRYISGDADLYALMSNLVSGTELPNLVNCFPEGTMVLGAVIDNGILMLNLSSDFASVGDTPGLLELARETVLLTVQEYGAVDEVTFLVNGVEYSSSAEE